MRPRIIPVLLLRGSSVVKSVRFRDHRYIGDPLNAARLFSEMGADELILLDIDASRDSRSISTDIVGRIAEEISMPLAAGGGITTADHVGDLIRAGVERVVLGTGAWRDPYLIKESAERFGSSAVSVCIDVGSVRDGKRSVRVLNGTEDTGMDPEAFARLAEEHGAGEVILQSIDRDGTMKGYDLDLIAALSKSVSIPVVALGGAGTINDLVSGSRDGRASAVAAGSLFVFYGPRKGVLINYPANKTHLAQAL